MKIVKYIITLMFIKANLLAVIGHGQTPAEQDEFTLASINNKTNKTFQVTFEAVSKPKRVLEKQINPGLNRLSIPIPLQKGIRYQREAWLNIKNITAKNIADSLEAQLWLNIERSVQQRDADREIYTNIALKKLPYARLKSYEDTVMLKPGEYDFYAIDLTIEGDHLEKSNLHITRTILKGAVQEVITEI